ncbi:sulfatase [Blastopirellula sp. J2-11]|uniref:sulfatase n=1 Tax=Blastopirellula sp. J2-11 TaxID=2943192 RepID=UPI0021C5B1FE|nr:sulfatase [Blastopirellula sp. J2-11]UUO06294.1 sulfatase [Blastopirellula sp. J2-11]
MRNALLTLCLAVTGAVYADAAQHPNFVFFLVDDLGWADVGCNGSTFYETPNIDKLASSGMRFTNGYAACPVCSPTRASIMTGRHPVRVDITDWIPGMNAERVKNHRFQQINDRDDLAPEETTIAESLRDDGYSTFFAGKWHLGDQGNWPTEQGFDINIGGHDRGSPPGGYYSPWNNPVLEAKQDGEYLTERLTDESIHFLETRDKAKPFFLYLAYYNVHTPIQPYKKRVDHYQEKAKQFEGETPVQKEGGGKSRMRQDNPQYASMVAAVDDSVGAILAALDRLNLTDNTVVIFFSDNGGLCTVGGAGPTSNLPLRSGKGWLYEGGVREPMIIRAPGVTKAGSVCDTPVVSMDFFPTIRSLAGLPAQPKLHLDGQNLVPLLEGKAPTEDRAFYWHYPHYHGSKWTPGASIRDGDWKLIEFYEEDRAELYNLQQDPGELQDLSQSNPDKAAELRQKLQVWQTKMNAKMPQEVAERKKG